MGSATYDGTVSDFDDRLLLHLQIVIVNTLRRRENATPSAPARAPAADRA